MNLNAIVCSIARDARAMSLLPKACEMRDMELVPIISFRDSTTQKIVENMVTPAMAPPDILPSQKISTIS